ncbi:DUF1236 domain-containing protein [Bradyrhizobium sp. CCGUVB1N3]|uniref:DUF1236 domain-containing protein n=1 Tax=Bradyrhizobium sp. CCGUVB1N3 TaxID=2949629 RepID=UPI0020B1DE0C|nr:DUF1236 domain-containing protein [Bradyrhizobium sp. CCGUVB1N3]MCP3470082.1 DUF1236 domain-containing protein [Bradyrhizobium sp. CCGUVB1N3]
MMNRFMISVAALALVAGTGFASAQGMNREQGSGGSQQMQQHSQPSTGAAEHGATGKESQGKEKGTVGQAGGSMKSGAEEKSSGAMKDEKSSGTMHKNPTAEEKSGATKGQRTDERAQGQHDKSKGMSSETQTKSGTAASENRQGQTGASTSTQTTGQAAAGAKLSTEQRTQITSVIREEKVAPVGNVNFSVSVGTRIPREGIELHALPSRVVTIYPEWRSYRYVLVRDEIVIIDPVTYEIVAVLNV